MQFLPNKRIFAGVAAAQTEKNSVRRSRGRVKLGDDYISSDGNFAANVDVEWDVH